jgi:hypothetical protein
MHQDYGWYTARRLVECPGYAYQALAVCRDYHGRGGGAC